MGLAFYLLAEMRPGDLYAKGQTLHIISIKIAVINSLMKPQQGFPHLY